MGSFSPGLSPSQNNYAEPAQWRQIVRQSGEDLRCASPGFLVEDMAANQTVTVQIAIQERVRPASGPAQWMDIPPITSVPIIVPRGGGFSTTFPLKKGDQGILIFCDTCFDNWWMNGQTNAPPAVNVSSPSGSQRQFEVRRHHVHDCGFFPGMWSKNNLIPNYSTDSMQLRADDGSAIIDVAAGGVTVTVGDSVVTVSNGGVSVKGAVVTASDGGLALPLMNDNFYQWFLINIMPFLTTTLHYIGPPPPVDSETIVLKGQ